MLLGIRHGEPRILLVRVISIRDMKNEIILGDDSFRV